MGLFLVFHRHVYYPGLLSVMFLSGDCLATGTASLLMCGAGLDDAGFMILRCIRGWVSTPSYGHAIVGFVTRDFVFLRMCWWQWSPTGGSRMLGDLGQPNLGRLEERSACRFVSEGSLG